MYRLCLVISLPLLCAFAPVPPVRPMTDPDRAIQQFDNNARALQTRCEKTFADRKQRLLERLRDYQNVLTLSGRLPEADSVRDRIVLFESIDGQRPLGKVPASDLLTKASADGKYRTLMHVVYIENDLTTYAPFVDFGFWNGSYYAGQSKLQPGHWVYVKPRWFVWKEGPPPPPPAAP